jgi:endoglucanase
METPWTRPMPEEQFEIMRDILAAPSPVGFEGAMTHGVLAPYFDSFKLDGWGMHQYRGNAGVVFDTHPGQDDMFSVMVIGHADKIRMQVRSIGEDGKIWINSDSFLPTTLIGHEVVLFSENPADPGHYRRIEGGTVEAIGAIHFADAKLRSGASGIKSEMLYLELQLHGSERKKQVEALGIRSGDPIILNRPIKRGFAPDAFYGAYLDNGLGCFVTAEICRLVAERGGLSNVRLLGAMAAYEEIGRFGSRVLAGELRPDVVIAVDVAHDFVSAPGIKDRRMDPIAMGDGFVLAAGATASNSLNSLISEVAVAKGIPHKRKVCGRDTGTDAMAAVLASVDSASASIGFPIRNMHTISESGHTGDVLASIHVLAETLFHMDGMNDGAGMNADDLRGGHPRLDGADPLGHQG